METPVEPNSDSAPVPSMAEATSELNNLLQIISGTSSAMETANQTGEDSAKYLAMLRTSIARAERLAADLAAQAGGTGPKAAVNPDLAAFTKSKQGPSAPKKHSILLVDDEKMAIILVKRILSDAGFEVTTAQSGFECLDAFRCRPHAFDLVLLDLTMPFMDGEETFGRLREIRSDIPVVLCTGFIQQERLNRLMANGLSGFMRKPISPKEIVSLVRSTLASVRYSTGPANTNSVTAII